MIDWIWIAWPIVGVLLYFLGYLQGHADALDTFRTPPDDDVGLGL